MYQSEKALLRYQRYSFFRLCLFQYRKPQHRRYRQTQARTYAYGASDHRRHQSACAVASTWELYKDNQEATVYDFYSALLDQNKDGYRKDILNVFEKSYLAGQLLNLTN